MGDPDSPGFELRAHLIVLEQALGLVIKQLPDQDRSFLLRALAFRRAQFEDADDNPAFAPDLNSDDRIRLSDLVQERWDRFNSDVLEMPQREVTSD